MTLLLSVIDTN